MAIIYRSNPMPTKGALFVTNPRRKPVLRVNRRKFARFLASKIDGDSKKFKKYDTDKFKRSEEYRALRAKYLPMYEKQKDRHAEVLSRASLKIMLGQTKSEAKKKAVAQLRKLGMTQKEAGDYFEKKYRPMKNQSRGSKSSTQTKTNPRGKTMSTSARRSAANKKAKALIKKGRLLSFAKFRSLYKGCGYSVKTVARMYKKYKNEVLRGKAGKAPGKGRIGPKHGLRRLKRKKASAKRKASTKKKTSAKKKASSKKKGSSRKKLSAYQKFVKSKAGKGLSMAKIADMWRKSGKAKSSAKKARSSSARKSSKRKVSKWTAFQKKMGGRGLSNLQLKRLYKRSKAEQDLFLKRRPKFRKRKGESTAAAKRRYKQRTGSLVTQGKQGKRRLIGPVLMRLNPKSGVLQPILGLFDMAEGIVEAVPVVGSSVAPFTKPILLGASMGALSFYSLKKFGPDLYKVPYVGNVLEKGAYTVGGSAIALICMLGSRLGLFDSDNASLVASAAVLTGAAIDVHDHLMGVAIIPEISQMQSELDELISPQEDQEAEAIASDLQDSADLGAINLSGYGDGGAYIIGSGSAALGALNLGAVHLGHAAHAPQDFSMLEGQAIMQGPDALNAVAARPGMEGKRWAWLVKMIGFDNVQELAKLPPRKRVLVIRKLKRNASQYAQQLLAPAQESIMEDVAMPIANSANGVGAVGAAHGMGYGALMLAGSGY